MKHLGKHVILIASMFWCVWFFKTHKYSNRLWPTFIKIESYSTLPLGTTITFNRDLPLLVDSSDTSINDVENGKYGSYCNFSPIHALRGPAAVDKYSKGQTFELVEINPDATYSTGDGWHEMPQLRSFRPIYTFKDSKKNSSFLLTCYRREYIWVHGGTTINFEENIFEILSIFKSNNISYSLGRGPASISIDVELDTDPYFMRDIPNFEGE
jgi:hypothetical protein